MFSVLPGKYRYGQVTFGIIYDAISQQCVISTFNNESDEWDLFDINCNTPANYAYRMITASPYFTKAWHQSRFPASFQVISLALGNLHGCMFHMQSQKFVSSNVSQYELFYIRHVAMPESTIKTFLKCWQFTQHANLICFCRRKYSG